MTQGWRGGGGVGGQSQGPSTGVRSWGPRQAGNRVTYPSAQHPESTMAPWGIPGDRGAQRGLGARLAPCRTGLTGSSFSGPRSPLAMPPGSPGPHCSPQTPRDFGHSHWAWVSTRLAQNNVSSDLLVSGRRWGALDTAHVHDGPQPAGLGDETEPGRQQGQPGLLVLPDLCF